MYWKHLSDKKMDVANGLQLVQFCNQRCDNIMGIEEKVDNNAENLS